LHHFEEAMAAIYGSASGIEDFELKSQAMAYDAERAMFEAYSRNKYGATGIIQWMLNNAWPSLIWHLYDYYLQPAGGYFGAKKACEPLHVQYSYDDRSIAVVNSAYRDVSELKVTAKLYDAKLHELFSGQAAVQVASDGVAKALAIPEDAFHAASPIFFLSLKLEDGGNRIVSTNFYWLSPKSNRFDWPATTYRYTPVSAYEDLTALRDLPSAGSMELSASTESNAGGPLVRVHIRNPSNALAFQLSLGIRRKGGEADILPVLWEDNYFELMPGESRDVTAQFLAADALEGDSVLTVNGWNISPQTLSLNQSPSDAHLSIGQHP
jgi:exo-1,4-beta-D-glucosaminidase